MSSSCSVKPFESSVTIGLFYTIDGDCVGSLLPSESDHHVLAITNKDTANVFDLSGVIFVKEMSDVCDFEFFEFDVLKHCLSSSLTAVSSVSLICVWGEFMVVNREYFFYNVCFCEGI